MNTAKEFHWIGSDKRMDESPYLASERRGYEVSIRPIDDIDLPQDDYIVFTATSEAYDYTMPYGDLGNPLAPGDWLMSVRDVDKEGRVSDWSFDITITIEVAPPKSPTGLTVLYTG